MPKPSPAGSATGFSLKTWADKPLTQGSPLLLVLHRLLRVLYITAVEFKHCELSLRASALTYTILLSLVPMLAMSTALVKGLGGGDQLREAAYSYIGSLERHYSFEITDPVELLTRKATQPDQTTDLTGHLRSAADKLFDYVDRTNFATLGTFGVVGMLLSILLMLSHIESAMNAIWKVSAARSIGRKIADYLTLMVLLPISINVAFAATAFLKSPVLAAEMDRFIPFEWLQSLLLKPVPIFFIAVSFYAMYMFFPNTRVRTIPALTGAILAAALWFMMQNVYISLQLGVARYNAIYGSFATLPLFLIWMYLGWVFILTGAQVAYAVQHLVTYRLTPLSRKPSLKLSAAFDVMDLVYRAFDTGQRLTPGDLAAPLDCYPTQLVDDTTEELVRAGILHLSSSDERLLPTSSPEHYDRQEIVRIILGTETPETAGGTLSRDALEAAERTSGSTHRESG